MNFKPHKIPNIDKNICNKEQVIAYNYLFSRALSNTDKNTVLNNIQKELCEKSKSKNSCLDYDLIYHYILQSYDRYKNAKYHIFSNYETLSSVIYSDII